MNIIWEQSGDAFDATAVDPSGAVCWRLIVEFDGAGWDWTVWREGDARDKAKHGHAATMHGAMWDAERAAAI